MKTLILDPAHGINVSGKRSPDGKHEEWKWSRIQIYKLINKFSSNTLNFYYESPFLKEINEPGLIRRVNKYNQITAGSDITLMLSLHNDANHESKCDRFGWGKAKGIAFWTSRGETKADEWATFMFNRFNELMSEENYRKAMWLGEKETVADPDYESDFTILAGNKIIKPVYEGILMEVLFQNTKSDVEKLLDPIWNEKFNQILFQTIIDLYDYCN